MCKLSDFEQKLKLFNKAEKTIKAYSRQFKLFIEYFENDDIRYLSNNKIEAYIISLYDTFGYSAIVHAIYAIEFYYLYINSRKRKLNLPRPRKPKTLPIILSGKEVSKMINKTLNLKHKALLAVTFYHGLRRNETLTLKITDVDSANMRLHIRQSKNKKDRKIPLSQECLDILRDYYKIFKPKEYLFNGDNNLIYSTTSLTNAVKAAALRAKINKNIHPHTLRHSFASYLVSQGVHIRQIQEWLGHASVQTTEKYCHLSDNVQNPIQLNIS
jgi:site-specific recombinase XerD